MWKPARPTCGLIRLPGAAGLYSILSLILSLVIAGCDEADRPLAESEPPPLETISAEVLRVEMRAWPTVVRSQGSLYADEQSTVGTKVAGRVAEVHVDLGDFVRIGDPLVTLEEDEFQMEVAQAEAQLDQARSAVGLREGDPVGDLDPLQAPPVRQERALWQDAKSGLNRIASLRDQNAVSQGEYDTAVANERVAESRYASAMNGVREKIALIGVRQAELSLARQRLRDAVIAAPLDGYVRERQTAPGAYLTVGQAVANLVRTDPLRFRGTVPERHAQALAIGQEVRLKIESVAQPRTARISRVSPALDPQSRSLAFEADMDNGDYQLRAGLFVEAEVVIDTTATALVVPQSAVLEFAGAEKVWKVVDGIASEEPILCGERRGEECEIIEGLEVGDMILRNAIDGRAARIEPAPEKS